MKIAYIISSGTVISGKSNGVRSQALSWKNALEARGHEIVLIDNWGDYHWSSFDCLHLFGYDSSILSFVKPLSEKNANIFISPIIDSTKSYFLYKIAAYNSVDKLRLHSSNSSLRKALKFIKGVCVRTHHEENYFLKSFGVTKSKVNLVELSYGIQPPSNVNDIILNKEKFCLHVSSLYQQRKNVERLIQAAIRFDFKLKLVGNTGNAKQTQMIKSWIGDNENIELLGFVSSAELIALYEQAQVFALPSTCEGVGIVALDAALYGCNLAITNIDGPKEYYPYSGNVSLIDPYNVNDIGEKISRLLTIPCNIELSQYIKNKNSINSVANKLELMYLHKSI